MSTFKEKVQMWVAWHLPRWLVYFAVVRIAANATQGEWSGVESPAITVSDAMQRWGFHRARGE